MVNVILRRGGRKETRRASDASLCLQACAQALKRRLHMDKSVKSRRTMAPELLLDVEERCNYTLRAVPLQDRPRRGQAGMVEGVAYFLWWCRRCRCTVSFHKPCNCVVTLAAGGVKHVRQGHGFFQRRSQYWERSHLSIVCCAPSQPFERQLSWLLGY